MAVQDKIKRIAEVCKTNGVAISGKLSGVGVTGYASDGCQVLAESCVDKMEEYCRYGVNYGFGGVSEPIEAVAIIGVVDGARVESTCGQAPRSRVGWSWTPAMRAGSALDL